MAGGELLTTAEAARWLGMTATGIRSAIRDGRLTAQRFGRDLAISADEVERYRAVMASNPKARGWETRRDKRRRQPAESEG